MLNPPRTFTISARAFDGSTRPNNPASGDAKDIWTPAQGANGPLQSKNDQDQIGRFAWSDLLRSSTQLAMVMIRSVDTPDPSDVFEVRSVAADEVPSTQAAPHADDSLIRTVQLSTEWSDPALIGALDAIAIQRLSTGGFDHTVEIVVFEVAGELVSDLIRAYAQKCCDSLPTIATFDITDEGAGGVLPDPTADLNFYRFVSGNVGTFTVPSPAGMSTKQEIYIENRDPAQPVSLRAPAGCSINGVANPTVWITLASFQGVALRRETATEIFGTTN